MDNITKTDYTEKKMSLNYSKRSDYATVHYYFSDGTNYKKVSPMQYNRSGLKDVTHVNSNVYDVLISDLRKKNMFSLIVAWNTKLNNLKAEGIEINKKSKYELLYNICNA